MMSNRLRKAKKLSSLFLVGAVIVSFQTGAFAAFGENEQSIAESWECEYHPKPILQGPNPYEEYFIGANLVACHGDDWETCYENDWLHLDLAWACNADCSMNGGSGWHGVYQPQGFCDGECTCTEG
jgi:hypothetical protein